MLFDLRSRGRRRTVQVVYLGLALLMGGGLVLFGVGAGNGVGGLLNAFTGNGSGNSQGSVVSSQEKAALKQTRLDPSNPAGWASLIQARWETANSGSNYNPSNGTFTTSGKTELAKVANSWQHYSALTKTPNTNLATLAARAYGQLGQYANEANTWEIVAQTTNAAKGYECLALSSYAAKQTRKGDLALNKFLTLVPKLSRKNLKSEIQAAQTSPSLAASC
jgi:hypothetical protein